MNELNDEMREFARLAGFCWHEIHTELDPDNDGWMWSTCSCGKDKWMDHSLDKRHRNPDLSDPIVVLGIMRKREDWPEFVATIGFHGWTEYGKDSFVDINYLLSPNGTPERSGKMLRAAGEYLKGR
jgi:hypothetical protein